MGGARGRGQPKSVDDELGAAVYLALKFGGEIDHDTAYKVNRLLLAERFHWTLDTIDALDMQDLAETQALLRALDLARKPAGSS